MVLAGPSRQLWLCLLCFTRMAWYDPEMTQKLKDLASEPGVIPKHWSSCGQIKNAKKPGYFHYIHCSVCSDPQHE